MHGMNNVKEIFMCIKQLFLIGRSVTNIFISFLMAYMEKTEEWIFMVRSQVQCDSFGTGPKKMRISQRLFIRF